MATLLDCAKWAIEAQRYVKGSACVTDDLNEYWLTFTYFTNYPHENFYSLTASEQCLFLLFLHAEVEYSANHSIERNQ